MKKKEKEIKKDEISMSDLTDLLGNISESYIDIDVSNLKKLNYNFNDFKNGISDMSYIAGQITALTTVGVTADEALGYIMALQSMDLQKYITNEANTTTLKVTENQSLLSEKNLI